MGDLILVLGGNAYHIDNAGVLFTCAVLANGDIEANNWCEVTDMDPKLRDCIETRLTCGR